MCTLKHGGESSSGTAVIKEEPRLPELHLPIDTHLSNKLATPLTSTSRVTKKIKIKINL